MTSASGTEAAVERRTTRFTDAKPVVGGALSGYTHDRQLVRITMERLSVQVQTAYAELVEQLVAGDTQRAIGHSKGAFVVKLLKGQEYYYFQHALPGGIVQTYVGRRTPALDAIVARFKEGRELATSERLRTTRLSALLRSGGAIAIDGPSARVLEALADADSPH